MNPLKKEIPYLSIALLPFIYLAFIWNQLPEKVPMHWNTSGEIDRWGDRKELVLMILMLVGLTYVLFLVIPKIDPKQKLKKMGDKFENLRLIMTFFMSALALYILYSIQKQSSEPAFIVPIVGLLFAFLGNYFKTLKPNYFIGIKTPWTLESEIVWKKTHEFAGVIWFIGGLLLFIIGLFLNFKIQIYFVLGISLILIFVPIIYSYLEFQKLNKK